MSISISKKIIFNSDQDVAHALRFEAELDVIDEYGYTPLVQCAIVNSVAKAEILLKAGAKVDFPDLTGRTPLHWAASNGNFSLCELFLNNGADPNACTNVGQSVLVIPYLRKQRNITELLFKKGGDLNFALDFINAKLLGHQFELEGRVDVLDNNGVFMETECEGFYLEFSVDIVANSLIDFANNFAGKHLRRYFSKLSSIIGSLQNAIELLKYQHYLVDVEEHKNAIDALLDKELLILPIAFSGHAITLIKYWDWLIRCDRGEFGKNNGTVIFYYMRNPHLVTKPFIKELLYKRQYAESINEQLAQYLDLEVVWKLPLSLQISGNCSWANVEAVVPAILFMLLLQEKGGRDVEIAQKEALDFYEEWVAWDQNRALHFCLESFNDASPARQAAKATLLAAVLFQAFKYDKLEDRDKSERMLKILTLPDYRYVLESYLKVFSKQPNDPDFKNLTNFLDDFGVELRI